MHVDNFLLTRAQRFSDCFTEWTGLTKFWLEKWSLIGAVVSLIVVYIQTTLWIFGVFALMMLLIGSLTVVTIEFEERDFLSRGRLYVSIMHNHVVRRGRTGFYIALGFLSAWMFSYAFAVWCMFNVARVYFEICVPKRPGKSKLRKLIDSGKEHLRNSLSDTPTVQNI